MKINFKLFWIIIIACFIPVAGIILGYVTSFTTRASFEYFQESTPAPTPYDKMADVTYNTVPSQVINILTNYKAANIIEDSISSVQVKDKKDNSYILQYYQSQGNIFIFLYDNKNILRGYLILAHIGDGEDKYRVVTKLGPGAIENELLDLPYKFYQFRFNYWQELTLDIYLLKSLGQVFIYYPQP